MASREELAKALSRLRDAPSFHDYRKTLQDCFDAVVQQLIDEKDTSQVEVLRGEARTYARLLKQINTN